MLLKSSKLYLRFPRQSDAPKLFDAVATSRRELERFMPWAPLHKGLDDSKEFIDRCAFSRRERNHFVFGIFDCNDKSYIGTIGLHNCKSANRSAEIGYWIRTSRAGEGLATESAALVVELCFRELKRHRLLLRAATDNAASIRIAEKLGFIHEGTQRHQVKLKRGWIDLKCYSMLETEYRILRSQISKLISR